MPMQKATTSKVGASAPPTLKQLAKYAIKYSMPTERYQSALTQAKAEMNAVWGNLKPTLSPDSVQYKEIESAVNYAQSTLTLDKVREAMRAIRAVNQLH